MSIQSHSLPGSARRAALKRQLGGLLRVFTYLAVVGSLAGFCLARAASARIDEAVEQFGASLLQKLGPDVIGQAQQVIVNGQPVFFSSQVTDQSVAATLDALQRHCDSVASPALSSVGALPAEAQREILGGLESPRQLATGRYETDDHALGQIACIAHPQDGATLEQALDRALRFVDTGDLSVLGDARYFVVRQVQGGLTHVISVWTEGHFDLLGMFPGEGDAPGSDSPVVPRPPHARRTFTGIVPQRPYAVRMYESSDSREAILSQYDQQMLAAGWVERPTSEGDELRELTRAFSRQDSVAFLILDAARDGATPVTLIEVGGAGFVQATVQQ